jgi:phage head maturation protease
LRNDELEARIFSISCVARIHCYLLGGFQVFRVCYSSVGEGPSQSIINIRVGESLVDFSSCSLPLYLETQLRTVSSAPLSAKPSEFAHVSFF